MKQPEKTVSHELDLRDLVRVFLKRKFFLIIFTAAALILGIVVSLFVLPKKYVATASITVSPQPLTTAVLTEKVTISDPFFYVKSPTKAEYLNRIKSTEVMQMVIDSLSLNTTPEALRGAIIVNDVPSSELINITVIYSDADTARQIAGTLCTAYSQYVTNVRNEQFAKAKEFADGKIEEVNASYNEKKSALDLLLAEHDAEAILIDIERITEDIGENKTRRIVLETSIAADANFLLTLEDYYTSQEGISAEEFDLIIETAKSEGFIESEEGLRQNEPANSESYAETQIALSLSADALSETMLSYKYISAQLNMLYASSELAALDAKILDLEEKLKSRKSEYNLYSTDFELLSSGLLRDKSMMLAYDQRRTEIDTLTLKDTSSAIINISSEATASSQQASPNLIKNALIATVFGLALSGAIVYFKDFWWVNTGELKE